MSSIRSLYENIKKRRKELKMSQEELAKKIGYTNRSMIAKIEAGIVDIPNSKVYDISKALDISPTKLLGLEDVCSDVVRIGVYGTVPAGTPAEAVEDIIGYEEIPSDWLRGGSEYMGLTVKGDSMYPKYMDGDIVIIRLQPDCESGQDAVVYVNGYDATLKKVIKNLNGSITLEPFNRSYPPKTFGENDDPVVILGIVRELRRKVY